MNFQEIIEKFSKETDYNEVGKKLARLSRRIYPTKYYILDFNSPLNPKPVGRYYESYNQAYQAINAFFGSNHDVFIVISGKKLIRYIKYFKINPQLKKYTYKKGWTDQQKKSYRTKLRRQIRIIRALELREWKIDKSVLPLELKTLSETEEGKKKLKNYLSLVRKKYYRSLI